METAKKGPWHVSLFGGLTVSRNEGPETRIRSKKAGGVLGYLAYFRGQAFPRESLAEQYWPECDPETARQNLRAALAILRRQLEGPGEEGALVMADRDGVWLNADALTTDVSHFFELSAKAENLSAEERAELLVQAVSLVRGPLLPGHEGLWILPQQLHLDEEAAQVAVKAVGAKCESADYEGAIRTGKAALAKWPLREDIHVAVMRAQALAGRTADAIQQYEELERLLDENWGEQPSPEASRALEALPDPARPQARRSEPTPVTPAPFEIPKVPARLTSFVGRTEEVAEIVRATDPSSAHRDRLVTVTGPGGSGKTRLAMESARLLAESHAGRVWYVPLADTEDGTLVPLEIRKSLGLESSPNSDAMSQVTSFLGHSPSLLVLDNFEQLVEGGSLIVSSLLEACSNLTCLVTSRRALNVEGERLLIVRPLAVPSDKATGAALECGSVQLFVDRAVSANPGFRLSGHNSQAVAELCRRLEGLPLAIELAASRVSTMTPAQILGKLGQANEFLTSRLRTTPQRHRSLRATVEWSVRLLSEDARRVFNRVSVFRGGWTLEAASALCGEDNVEGEVQTLIDSSLIQPEPQGETMRFVMLEAVREQALALLLEAGEESHARQKHLEYFADFVKRTAPGLHGQDQGAVADVIEAEMDNLREAVTWSTAQASCPEAALTLVGSIRSFFGFRGHFELWFESVSRLLALPYEGQPRPRVSALLCAGGLGFYQAAFQPAKEAYEEARGLAANHGLDDLLCEAVFGVGVACRALGDFDSAFVHYAEALELSNKATIPHIACKIHYNMGLLSEFLDRFDDARRHYEESWRIAESAHDKRVVARNRDALGRCALHDGDPQSAIRHHETARRLLAEVGDRNGENEVLGNVALMELTLGRPEKALPLFGQTLELSWQMQSTWELRSNTVYVAVCLARLGNANDALTAWALAKCLDDDLGIEMRRADADAFKEVEDQLRRKFGPETLTDRAQQVRANGLGKAVAELASLSTAPTTVAPQAPS